MHCWWWKNVTSSCCKLKTAKQSWRRRGFRAIGAAIHSQKINARQNRTVVTKITWKNYPPPVKLTACPWKSTVGRCDSFWDQNLFSGALAVSFRKCNKNAKIQFDGPETLLGHRKVTLRFCTWWRIPSSALEKLTLSRWKSKAVGFWLQGGQIHQKQRWSMESCWWFFHVHLCKHLFEDVT